MSGATEWIVGLGLASRPVYLGSSEHQTRVVPLLMARWSNGWFAGTGGIGYRFRAGQPLSGGVQVTLAPGRVERDAEALRGMGDIKARPEVGAFVNYRLAPGLFAGSTLRFGSGNDGEGLHVDISMRAGLPVTGTLQLTASVTATAGNSRALQSQYGVDASQSLRTGYALTTVGGGLRDVSVRLGGSVMTQSRSILFFGLTAASLFGDAKSSPLTQEKTNVNAMVGLAYRL